MYAFNRHISVHLYLLLYKNVKYIIFFTIFIFTLFLFQWLQNFSEWNFISEVIKNKNLLRP